MHEKAILLMPMGYKKPFMVTVNAIKNQSALASTLNTVRTLCMVALSNLDDNKYTKVSNWKRQHTDFLIQKHVELKADCQEIWR
jgi:hypothetical protein